MQTATMTSRLVGVLEALADLAGPERSDPEGPMDVLAGKHPVVWLGVETPAHHLFAEDPFDPGRSHSRGTTPLPRSEVVERLRGLDALHREQQLLRMGWIFLCGQLPLGPEGQLRRVCQPLATRPVALSGSRLLGTSAWARGEVELLADVEEPPPGWDPYFSTDPGPEHIRHHTRMRTWIDEVVRRAGLPPISEVVGPRVALAEAARLPGLVAVLGYGLYVDDRALGATTARASSIRAWTRVPGIERSALAHLYGLAPAERDSDRRAAPASTVPQPLPLTATQAEVVARSREQPVTVVSGAPGNGKSHAVCAIAIDAVARGESVLVVAPTAYAADVLGDLLARHPGPEPVLFGETEGRRRMIHALEALAQRTAGDDELAEARAAWERAAAGRTRAEAAVTVALDREDRARRVDRWTAQLPDLRAAVPAVFAPGADLHEVRRRVAAVRAKPSWWRRRRLRRLVGSAPIVGVDTVADAVEAAADVRAEQELERSGGTRLAEAWDAYLAAEEVEAAAAGALVDAMARAERRWGRAPRRAVAGLLRALPAGRGRRRALLADLDAGALVEALPLWVGTLRDVDDLLPTAAGLFDLVLVDEAAQVDQTRAAGALLRADRAVVVGDPRQLRHVSFTSDATVADALTRHGVADLADRLDLRRQSLFDVAAGAAPVTFLDEHHRSVPHLIEFSSRRFYDGRVLVATRHPANESTDAIDVLRVGSVDDEVTAVVAGIGERIERGIVGIGAFTPFRAHADAIEAAVLDAIDPDLLDRHEVRVGTAHASQGSEHTEVLVALGLAVDDPGNRWRFAEDPNLFNVLVTRARRHLTVVTALPAEGLRRGLLADYLRHAETPPAAPGTHLAPPTPWIQALAAELERQGLQVRVGYPVGRWRVDLCVGEGDGAVAIDAEVHPDGAQAHLARHRTLRRAGWRSLDGFASRWDGDPTRAGIELAQAIRAASPVPPP